jgi:hypothetical protein
LLTVLTEMALMLAWADNRSAAAEAGREAVELLLSKLMGVTPGGHWLDNESRRLAPVQRFCHAASAAPLSE